MQRQQSVEQRAADDLVHRVVTPDVLAHEQRLATRGEQARGVHPAGAAEGRLAQTVGQRGEQRSLHRRAGGQLRCVDGDLLQRALAAHPARRRRVEAPGAGVAPQRPAHVDDVGGEVAGRAGLARRVDQPLAVEEAERELLVVAGRAHRDGQGGAVDADLQRLLDGDLVALAVALHDGGHAAGDGRAVAVAVAGDHDASAIAGVRLARSATGRTSTATTLYSGHDVLTSADGPMSRFVRISGK